VAISEHSGIGRRQAIRALASGAVTAVASASWVESLTALARQQAHAHAAGAAIVAQDWSPRTLTARQNDLVVALTELIIPETDTPGAKATNVNRFIDHVLTDAQPEVRGSFVRGLTWIDARSRALFKSKDFLGASPEQQATLLTRLSAEGNPDKEEATGRDFFQAIKSMTINGYYTTEIGLRKELGDNGQLFLPQFQGCEHPEHQ
jgi:Gluconate 2-dehydrogenase subunit 3